MRRKYNDPSGLFFREGGKQDIVALKLSARTSHLIEEIEQERDWRRLGRAYEHKDWLRILIFGREEQGRRLAQEHALVGRKDALAAPPPRLAVACLQVFAAPHYWRDPQIPETTISRRLAD